ncbi:MAG: DnaJ domain-containing protein [Phycisphaerales bacterium]|jgi:DnaJ-class molecular chaperone|nr:DnaJ domain-containing protein [Phycisphaerales bacterium]
MAKRDFYDILGISKTATPDEIKRAHRKLVRQYHPDVNKNNPAATEKFKEVQEAYDVLSDEPKRRNYDQFGHAGVGAGPPPGGDPYEAFRRGRGGQGGAHSWQAGPGVSVEDFDIGQGGLGDIFEQLFGAKGGRGATSDRSSQRSRSRPQQSRGADIEHPVTLTFYQAARGTKLPLQISRDGQLETIEVKIPPGVKDGSRIRIKGRGQQAGGEPGDLFIITQVTPHPYFRREELNILLDLPISLYESLLGTKVEVPTLDGPVTLTLPAGTSSGAKLRIKGRGIERGDEKGDQYVVVKIVVPKNLEDGDKETIEKLAIKYPISPRADLQW